MQRIQLVNFVRRQFSSNFIGTKILVKDTEFEMEINTRKPLKILKGYATFCKLFFYENWMPEVKSGTMKITRNNEKYLKSGYFKRTPNELPVLIRWFENIIVPVAKYIVLILYTKEQILKENKQEEINARYGVVSILGQMNDFEEPMSPITMMRNALGIKEGGSGTLLDKKKYMKSVEFWSNNAICFC